MKLHDIFDANKTRYKKLVEILKHTDKPKKTVCPACGAEIKSEKQNNYICGRCGHYFPMPPAARIALVGDPKGFKEIGRNMKTKDPLSFPGYRDKIDAMKDRTEEEDAVVTGVILIKRMPAAFAVMDSRFLMGSMGTVVGEKITSLTELAAKRKLPLIIFSASGGARMQEGLFSLMQMAKTSAAIERFKAEGGLFISVLTDPTTGGVSASFASLGDIIISEPGALICFAGPRVIEQTIGRKLPDGFQKAEFLSEHGMIDIIAERKNLRDTLADILKLHQTEKEKNDGRKNSDGV